MFYFGFLNSLMPYLILVVCYVVSLIVYPANKQESDTSDSTEKKQNFTQITQVNLQSTSTCYHEQHTKVKHVAESVSGELYIPIHDAYTWVLKPRDHIKNSSFCGFSICSRPPPFNC